MITRKTRDQIAIMRRAGKVVAEMHEVCIRAAKPGATTADVDEAAREVLDRRGARSNFLGYGSPPFPGVVCTSPNEVIVHGIPSPTVVLHDGDILSIDVGAQLEGYYGDSAMTVPVGRIESCTAVYHFDLQASPYLSETEMSGRSPRMLGDIDQQFPHRPKQNKRHAAIERDRSALIVNLYGNTVLSHLSRERAECGLQSELVENHRTQLHGQPVHHSAELVQ